MKGTDLEKKSLEDLVRTQKGPVFNHAAQTWNHTFYWNCLKPRGGGAPSGRMGDAIATTFGDFAKFKEAFTAAAAGHFGSGWAWLVRDGKGKLEVVQTHDAGNPLTEGKKPVLVCDVWEHAYYIDYRNARPKYIEAWWNLVHWGWAEKQLG